MRGSVEALQQVWREEVAPIRDITWPYFPAYHPGINLAYPDIRYLSLHEIQTVTTTIVGFFHKRSCFETSLYVCFLSAGNKFWISYFQSTWPKSALSRIQPSFKSSSTLKKKIISRPASFLLSLYKTSGVLLYPWTWLSLTSIDAMTIHIASSYFWTAQSNTPFIIPSARVQTLEAQRVRLVRTYY